MTKRERIYHERKRRRKYAQKHVGISSWIIPAETFNNAKTEGVAPVCMILPDTWESHAMAQARERMMLESLVIPNILFDFNRPKPEPFSASRITLKTPNI